MFTTMCESSVFLYEDGETRQIMADVTKITMEDNKATCMDILGDEKVLEGVELKEANLIGHGVVFKRV